MKKKKVVIKKYEKEIFPLDKCNLDPFWDDLLEEKNNYNEVNSGINKRHSLRNEK